MSTPQRRSVVMDITELSPQEVEIIVTSAMSAMRTNHVPQVVVMIKKVVNNPNESQKGNAAPAA